MRILTIRAADLQEYVEKASGAKLEIVTEDKLGESKNGARVFVGPCLAASRVVNIKELQPEGYERSWLCSAPEFLSDGVGPQLAFDEGTTLERNKLDIEMSK